VKDSAEEFVHNLIIKNQEDQKAIATNDEYIDWLIALEKKYTGSQIKLTQEEQRKYKRLENLFSAISDFCKNNYIEPQITHEFYMGYLISFKGKLYEIGCVYGQGAYHFFRLYDDSRDHSIANTAVNFEDIKSGNLIPHTQMINAKQEELRIYLKNMINDGVPCQAINEVAASVLKRKR